MNTVTGTQDESWFYLVTVAIEGEGGKALEAMMHLKNEMASNNYSIIINNLGILSKCLRSITDILLRMHEKNNPYVFYDLVRLYLTGWENSPRLPNGINRTSKYDNQVFFMVPRRIHLNWLAVQLVKAL